LEPIFEATDKRWFKPKSAEDKKQKGEKKRRQHQYQPAH
jgi:hypothetical protein